MPDQALGDLDPSLRPDPPLRWAAHTADKVFGTRQQFRVTHGVTDVEANVSTAVHSELCCDAARLEVTLRPRTELKGSVNAAAPRVHNQVCAD